MTNEAWFGVTPEPIALKIAEHISMSTPDDRDVIIDTFAGAGANAIAFAQSGRWQKVIAIEKDPQVLQCAKHNAALYGVGDDIEWIEGDCFEVLLTIPAETRSRSAVFASPPWGGQSYRSEEVFDLSSMQPYSVKQLYDALSKVSQNLVLYLPRSSDLEQLAEFVEDGKQALCIYFGDMVNY
ncbi:MAG: uracil DNA glycosylase [Chaenotheca gracillima]|nr:MAG: uracil DNA glycosylase [Chaenotheca gracillima]